MADMNNTYDSGSTYTTPTSNTSAATTDTKTTTDTTPTTSTDTTTDGTTDSDTTSTDSKTTTTTQPNTSNTSYSTSSNLPIEVKNLTVEADVGTAINCPAVVSNAVGDLKFVTIGDLPSGTFINTVTGLFSGTPNGTPAQDIVEVKVTDSVGNTGVGEYTIILNPTLRVTGNQTATITAGGSISINITGAGGSGDYTYSVKDAPSTITIGYMSGVLTGSLSTVGDTVITVVVDDGIATVEYPVTVTVKAAPAPASNKPANTNFTQHRFATLGMAKLKAVISARTASVPEYRKSALDLLAATRYLCKDPTPEFLQAYTDMHIRFKDSWLGYNHVAIGMDTFNSTDLDFYQVVWWGFKMCVIEGKPAEVDWNTFLIKTVSQNLLYYLITYSKK